MLFPVCGFYIHNPGIAQIIHNRKDHKHRDEFGNFPIRLIVSVHGSSLQKLDFLAQQIMQQAVEYVTANLTDCDALIDIITQLNNDATIENFNNLQLFSLDVVSLFPSIPVRESIDDILNFLITLPINWFGVSTLELRNMLFFIVDNYEVEYNGCLLYTSPSPRDKRQSRMPSSA